MSTANERYFDSAVRHQIGVRRFASGEVKEILKLLEAADRELVLKLRRRLRRGMDPTSQRFRKLIQDMREARRQVMVDLRGKIRGDMLEFSRVEAEFESRLIRAALPIEVNMSAVPIQQLRALVTSRPFQGRLLRDWFGGLELSDRRNLEQAIRLGVSQGETIGDMVRRVAGTRAAGFRDGALSITRRNAEAVVRTAVNHVTNAAREELWEANGDIVRALRWTATLDGRTSAICRARDGRLTPVGDKPLPEGSRRLEPPGARPPAHVNCRSVMVAVLDDLGVVGTRATVTDTRTRARREVDFRRIARQEGRPIRDVRARWARENIGQVPAETNYNQFLRRQSAGFQDEVLGKTRGRLFRKGELDVDQFVDRRGNELTLSQLRQTQPEAFEKAGL